jgi:hypothetical protein
MLRRFAQGTSIVAATLLVAFAAHCDEPWFERHVFLPQQFFLVADHRIVFWVRSTAIAIAAILVALTPLLPKGASLRRLVYAVLLAALAAEGLLQWRVRHLVRHELLDAMQGLTTPDPRHGVTLAPSMDRLQRMSGRDIRFRTDAERRRISGLGIDETLPSLVFTGESTVAGHGLQWNETFAAILASRLQLQAVNLGSLDYRLDQSWLRLENQLPRLARPVAVVGLFMPGLLGRAFAGQRHPVARPTPAGGIELRPTEARTLIQSAAVYRIWKHLYWSDAELEEATLSAAAVLRDMDRQAKARRAPCIFVVTGHTPRSMLHELFQANGLDFVVVEVPADELLADGHPNPRGSVRIADALEPRLRQALAAPINSPFRQ